MNVIEETTCRLCSSTSDNNVNIFCASESDGLTSIGRMIVDCLWSELEPNTGYPEIVCHICQLQLNIFYEFKKKVFSNQEKFTAILSKAKALKPAPLSKKSPKSQKTVAEDSAKPKRSTRSTVKIEKSLNVTNSIESVELTVPQTIETGASPTTKSLKRVNDGDGTVPDIKFIKLETDALELDDDGSHLFREQASDDETEQYLEEQYLDNYSEIDENTEVEYVFEDEVDDENCNSFKEEYLKSGDDADTPGRSVKKVRKSKTPKVKKFVTERVLDADTMNEYDAVKCLNCNEYFETMDKFTTHHKACDKTACLVCGKMLSSSGMDLHMKQHDSEKPYICTICNKGFTTAQQCTDHEFRHKNQRPFECHICDKTFKMKCDLRTHIMCHNDIRKHACPICGKRFRMSSHVTAHIETHNVSNAFECTECGLMLKTSSSLKGHVSQMHSTSYKHNCPVCSRGFAKLDRYKRHMKTHEKKRMPLKSASSVQVTAITQ